MSEHKDEKYYIIEKELNKRIATNISALIKARHYSINRFAEELRISKASFTRQHIGQLLNHPEKSMFSVTFVLLCCDFFGISFENLISDKFDVNERIPNSTEAHKEYIEIEKILQQSYVSEEETVLSNFLNISEDSSIIIDPTNKFFRGYLQDYYCYYYPTSSNENKNGNKLIHGLFRLFRCGNYCKAELKINTSGKSITNGIFDKEYSGYAIISTAVHSLHCIMYGKEIGEFCFLMFRHFSLNQHNLYCRIAEVLSSASGTEDRYPTVIRMFLSKEPIKDEDLFIVASSLLMNHSQIAITKEALEKVASISDTYSKIVNLIIEENKAEKIFFINEQDDLNNIIKKFTKDKKEILECKMNIRNMSYAFKNNKASYKADQNITELLKEKGYYS